MLVHRHRRRSLTERGPRSKAERRARSTRSRTCRTSPARTPDERSREPNERLEVGESDSTFNVCYQLDYDALATRYTQHLRLFRRAAAAATAPRRGASSSARASRPRAASPSHNSTKVERKKSSKGAAKMQKRAAIFREEIINIPNRVSKQGGRAGRCPGPVEEVVAHLEVSRFTVLGSSLLRYINTDRTGAV